MDFTEDVASVDPASAADLHPLDYLQQLYAQQHAGASVSPAVTPPSLPAKDEPQGDGWRGLIHMLAPVIGAMAMSGNTAKQTGFMNGYSEGQQAVDADKRQKAQDAQRKASIASDYMLKIADQAQGITDPVQFQKFADLADAAFVKAGYGQPGEIKNQLAFPANKVAAKQLKELTDQLAGLDKQGYNLDDLAQSGAVVSTSDGLKVPIQTALQLTQERPKDASGKLIPKPAKAAATEEERYVAKWATENGLDPKTLTAEQDLAARKQFRAAGRSDTTGSDFSQFLTRWAKDNGKSVDQITSADEIKARKAFNDSTKDPQIADINLSLKQLQLDAAKQKAAGGSAYEVKPGSRDERIAQQLASGDLTFSDFNRLLGARSSQTVDKKLALYDKAMELNPEFKPAAFEMGYKFASNPKTQNQMASINNVLSGVPDLLKFSDAAKRSGVTAVNSLIVPGGVAVGGKTYSNFKTARTAFADELSGALGYGSATDMAREMGLDMTDANLSPENFRSALETVVVPFVNRKKASLKGQMGPYGGKDAPTETPATNAPIKIGPFTVKVKGQ